MLLPTYVALILLFVEVTLLFVAGIGAHRAAFFAGRTAAVRYSFERPDEAAAATVRAGRQAMVAFASGLARPPGAGSGGGAGDPPWADALVRAAEGQTDQSLATGYLRRRCRYAHAAVTVETDVPAGANPASWDADVVVTLRYQHPFVFPLIGRLLGERDPATGEYRRPVVAKIAVPYEGPQNDGQSVGIPYASPR